MLGFDLYFNFSIWYQFYVDFPQFDQFFFKRWEKSDGDLVYEVKVF